jgi:CheY-like chemotaxis protein
MTVNLLLVDDEPDAIELFRQKFRRELRQGEYAIHFATSGAEALELIAANGMLQSILLLSDINMPGMSGLELLAEVKRRWPALQVIMITAYGDAENRRRAMEAGASDFVTKPVDFSLLKQTLGSFMDGDGI